MRTETSKLNGQGKRGAVRFASTDKVVRRKKKRKRKKLKKRLSNRNLKNRQKFTGVLQENILTLLCFDTEACPIILAAVDVSLFESTCYRTIAERAIEYYRKYKKAPGNHLPDLVEEFLNSTKRSEVRVYTEAMRDLFGTQENINKKFILDELQAFVRQQSLRQSIVAAAEQLQAGRLDTAERILAEWLRNDPKTGLAGPLEPIHAAKKLISMELPPLEDIFVPILQFPGVLLLVAARGSFKTMFAIALAIAAASGEDLFDWRCEKEFRVLFIDGELPLSVLQARVLMLQRALGLEPKSGKLDFWSASDCYPNPSPNFADPSQTELLVDQCCAYDLVIVDNISALTRGVDLNTAEAWESVLDFAVGLRHKGTSTILVQHLGKDKHRGARGSSRQEDPVDVILVLDKTEGVAGQSVIRVSQTKARHHAESAFVPIEIEVGSVDGKFSMSHQPLASAKGDEAAEEYSQLEDKGLIVQGTQKKLAEKYGLSKYQVSRAIKKRRYKEKRLNQS